MLYFYFLIALLINTLQVHANPPDWDGYTELNPPPPPPPPEGDEGGEQEAPPTPIGHWDKRLTSFQKLIMTKSFKEEKVYLIGGCQDLQGVFVKNG